MFKQENDYVCSHHYYRTHFSLIIIHIDFLKYFSRSKISYGKLPGRCTSISGEVGSDAFVCDYFLAAKIKIIKI